jgi:hypothetical protein
VTALEPLTLEPELVGHSSHLASPLVSVKNPAWHSWHGLSGSSPAKPSMQRHSEIEAEPSVVVVESDGQGVHVGSLASSILYWPTSQAAQLSVGADPE